jgi:hypothetical protein
MKMVSVARKLSIKEECARLQVVYFGEEVTGGGHNHEKLSWVRVPVKLGLGIILNSFP